MKMRPVFFKLSFYLLVSLLFLFPPKTLAQFRSLNLAFTLPISDKANPGDIVSLTGKEGTLEPAAVEYDQKMFGVVVESPAFVVRTLDTHPVARSGVSFVNITTLGGPIKIGDFITSSAVNGHGQKADNFGGFMLGVALSDFDEKDGENYDFQDKKIKKGQIKVEVGIGPASPTLLKSSGGLFGTFKQLLSALAFNIRTSKQTEKIIRYIMAAMVAVIVIFINFNTFGKNITKGIEAIGRNPLAKMSIESMIIVNVVLIALVSIGGIVLSLAILSL
ncbi:hypothetical protein A3D05_01485 [Candidatus Gottesmanbacteria bacterium RIFCSPHIGHO2_02_FULL_40_24]|uniref:Uncharacterized protein n=1 Tax=Candidatus Gottesmanbacteria bacterium RIFCSPHIGHO2_01_FULL_40_15 TaxID=1798376 RepID=A0A1F5YZW3_9BACT|nr:MAG: hypothetical protein A2777_04390 [Candidatus Gottesmanbacteria bacterium RIFCSPHIGHO2_01_FULL_40_15]OGG16343.1 MAG: hypothetical protein A3D05_01485 [Candidatus Gottesmanbacteria bacterium RIFCSPHIGHO2_02_FULL_40_24]OGG23457.1 MAG: hypothetical protein A3E42_00245 [Candidatus Gottesmanbacteria bacterium RIFCSPHIGHO2_12_FULL_40_13]OGG33056.1 MAG: hypothetical protein A3I80_04030 [Candidatus Gottesmanbacteria bacterium RIFCSPLOWO2_02_FULL_40_10]